MVNTCLRYFLWEFHYSRFCLCHENDKRFSEAPWLPSKWYYQLIYIVYRWIATLFFLSYLVVSGVTFSESEARYLIFLTNWAFILLNAHLLWSAIFVTVRYFQVHVFCRERFEAHNKLSKYQVYDKPAGCCGVQKDGTVWYQKVQWVLFSIGAEAAILVTILYWSLLYRGGNVSQINLVTHTLNGVMALLDMAITGIPVRILHVVYPLIFCGSYSVFTGVYYGAGGVGIVANQTYIYPALDYESSPGFASGLIIAVNFVACPLIHLLFWGLYLAREGVLHLIKHICCKRCLDDQKELYKSTEMQDPN